MIRTINELKHEFKNQNILMQLILSIALIFVAVNITFLVFWLFKIDRSIIDTGLRFLKCPADPVQLLFRPWTPFTYMFLHEDFMHILFNLLILFWFGKIYLEYLGSRNFLSVFILGGLSGAGMYILSYNLFPVFTHMLEGSTLLGASAGVIAIVVAVSTFVPNYTLHLLFIGPVKIKYIAIAMVVFYLIDISKSNPGGNLAHIGGAIWGYFYAIQFKKGNDYSARLTKLLEQIVGTFSGSRSKMKPVYKKAKSEQDYNSEKAAKQEVIDKILDKISKSGYGSLSEEEKKTLFNASKN